MDSSELFNELKKPFTEVNICEDSGIVALNEDVDPSHLKKIRMWNLIEAIVSYGLTLLIIWTSMLDTNLWWMWAGLGGMLIWLFFLSPIIHYKYEKEIFLTEEQQKRGVWFYFFECRGLGSAKRYYFSVDGEEPLAKKHLKKIIGLTIFLDVLFIIAAIEFDPEITEMLGDLGQNIAIKVLVDIALLVVIDAALIFLAYPVMLRLDNFGPSLKFIIAFIIITIPLILLFNLMFQLIEPTLGPLLEGNPYMSFRGDTAAERLLNLDLIAVGGQWAGYVFWGWLQQMLFLSVFNTFFARAFEIRERKGLILAAFCTALYFGLIHIPNFWLSLFTFISGFVWALYFMQERNLMAMGIVHGFGGTLLNKLAPISFSVGPSEVA